MIHHYRFGDYQQKPGPEYEEVSFNSLKLELETDTDGNLILERQLRIVQRHLTKPTTEIK